MTWRGWVITVTILILSFIIMYAASIYGGNKVDRFLDSHTTTSTQVAISNTVC